MGELTTDSTPGGSTPAAAPTAASVAHDPRHHAIGCPESFKDLQRSRDWWKARPEASRLVGLVVVRDDMPPVVSSGTTWLASVPRSSTSSTPLRRTRRRGEQRFGRMFETLRAGDVLVVVSERALGEASDEVAPPSGRCDDTTSWSRR
jgi:hypothetical protein